MYNFERMHKTIQKYLLTLFILLQCLSPLAHAHVGGQNADHSLHSHGLDVPAKMAAIHIENDEGAVVVMPHAYPIGESPVIPDHPLFELATGLLPVDHEIRSTNIVSGYSRIIRNRLCYELAWSQAPPLVNSLV